MRRPGNFITSGADAPSSAKNAPVAIGSPLPTGVVAPPARARRPRRLPDTAGARAAATIRLGATAGAGAGAPWGGPPAGVGPGGGPGAAARGGSAGSGDGAGRLAFSWLRLQVSRRSAAAS